MEGAVQSALAPHGIDEDTREYIVSLLEEDPNDDDAREAVEALIQGALDDADGGVDSAAVVASFFALLRLEGGDDTTEPVTPTATPASTPALRLLDQSVTMKQNDIQSFAMGLEANNGCRGRSHTKKRSPRSNNSMPT